MPKPAESKRRPAPAPEPAPGRKRKSAKVLLTDLAVRTKYKPQPREREIPDAGAQGLRLVIQPSGHKSWAVRFRRPDGRPAKLTLGTVDLSGKEVAGEPEIGMPLTLSAARLLTAKVHRDRKSDDVIAKRKIEKLRNRAQTLVDVENNFADLARIFVDEHVKPNTRRWLETTRNLGLRFDATEDARKMPDETKTERLRRVWPLIKGGLAERWSERTTRSIDATDLWAVVEEARIRAIPGVAARTKGESEARARALFSALSRMFSWLAGASKSRKKYIPTNPLAGEIGPPPPKARDRYLSDDEIRWFWQATAKADNPLLDTDPRPYEPALKIMLLTAQRESEVAGMRRSEIRGDEWHMGAMRTKNREPHVVHLAPQVQALIPSGNHDLIFTTTGTTPISSWSKVKRRVDAEMQAIAKKEKGPHTTIPHWVFHDLRRTASTGMGELEIPDHIIDLVTNHVTGGRKGVTKTYNRSKNLNQRRIALETWAAHVEGLVNPKPDGNVVTLAGAKARRGDR